MTANSRQPIHLRRVLKSSGTVRELLSEVRNLQALLSRVRKHLTPPLDEHCHAALIRKRRLLLFADSPAWASRLRYFSRDLMSLLRKEGMAVDRVSIRVMFSSKPKEHRQAVARRLSPDNASLIRQIAEGIEDKGLSAALRRLSRHS